MKKAVVLLSGGMDSAVTLYMAMRRYECSALIFDYGQKAVKELECAETLCRDASVRYHVMKIDMPWKGSALLDEATEIPGGDISAGADIPVTYVPSRNIIFLSFASSFAESIGAGAVCIGAHQLDYSNYPDCRSDFFDSYRETLRLGTRQGVQGNPVKIVTPVIDMSKREIILKGAELGVPFEKTWSCYARGQHPCGKCESCLLRARAFEQAGIEDPLLNN
ncbi:MAG: 7-cyano-7-deazaguanine synthase QueC [Candidatus Omnitrophica bacterium]|nr:7-cyano-7-deazaguanine synthase QueC [Candidatus Omnitrophota bacterium]